MSMALPLMLPTWRVQRTVLTASQRTTCAAPVRFRGSHTTALSLRGLCGTIDVQPAGSQPGWTRHHEYRPPQATMLTFAATAINAERKWMAMQRQTADALRRRILASLQQR